MLWGRDGWGQKVQRAGRPECHSRLAGLRGWHFPGWPFPGNLGSQTSLRRLLPPAGDRWQGPAAAAQRRDDEVHGAEAGARAQALLPHRPAEAGQVLNRETQPGQRRAEPAGWPLLPRTTISPLPGASWGSGLPRTPGGCAEPPLLPPLVMIPPSMKD